MGPASDTMTTDMSASDSFSALKVTLPRLAKNGENWLTYQEKVTNAIMARNLRRHLTGTAKQPADLIKDKDGKFYKADDAAKKALSETELEAHEIALET